MTVERYTAHPQLDPVIRRVHEILLGAQIALGGLHRLMPQQHLDLLQLPAGGTAQLRACAETVVGRFRQTPAVSA